MLTPTGEIITAVEDSPARDDYPTSLWKQGEIVRAPFRFRVPAAAPAGPARLQITLLSPASAPSSAAIADLRLRVPARVFVLPAISHPRADLLGGQVKWLGYDLTAAGVVLYWQPLDLLEANYKVFVHALDADHHILAQSDALPAGGARPTTGWLPGEIIADAHALALAGAGRLEIGLYDEQNIRLGVVTVALR
jgi:hypothetical protein